MSWNNSKSLERQAPKTQLNSLKYLLRVHISQNTHYDF